MAIPFPKLHRKSQPSKLPLLMERMENHNDCEHVIDITRSSEASSSSSSHDRPYSGLDPLQTEEQPSTSLSAPVFQPSFSTANGSNSRNSSFIRRGSRPGRRRSPLNSGLWISVELVVTVSQIIASVVVLSFSRDEHPHAPLFEWIVGYAFGCVTTHPLLYWRFRHCNQASEQGSSQPRPSPPESSLTAQTNSYNSSFVIRTLEDEDHQATATASGSGQSGRILNARFVFLLFVLRRL